MKHIQAIVSLILAWSSLSHAQALDGFMPSARVVGWTKDPSGAAVACSPAMGANQTCYMPGYFHLNANQPKYRYVLDNAGFPATMAAAARAAASEAVRAFSGRIFLYTGALTSDVIISQDETITTGTLEPVSQEWSKFVRFDCDNSLATDERLEDANGEVTATATTALGAVRRCLAPTVRVDVGSYSAWVMSWALNQPVVQQQAVNRLYTYIYATITGAPAHISNDVCAVNRPKAVTSTIMGPYSTLAGCDYSRLAIARTCNGKYVDLHNWSGETSTALGGVVTVGDVDCQRAPTPQIGATGYDGRLNNACQTDGVNCYIPDEQLFLPRWDGDDSTLSSGDLMSNLTTQAIMPFCTDMHAMGWACLLALPGQYANVKVHKGTPNVIGALEETTPDPTTFYTSAVGNLIRYKGCSINVSKVSLENQFSAQFPTPTNTEKARFAMNVITHALYKCAGLADSSDTTSVTNETPTAEWFQTLLKPSVAEIRALRTYFLYELPPPPED